MIEKIDFKSLNKKRKINEIIQSILNIKRQETNENKNETPEIKLGRRMEQRSYEKLSKEILEHIITRYEIDNDKLPTRETLIDLMIRFLGNIQKTPDYYNLKNDKQNKYYLKKVNYKLGEGVNGKVYSITPDELITKKENKALAFKLQEIGKPYNIDVHISSAILLAFYDFQPKYYNKYFMEIGRYARKSKERTFINIKKDQIINQKIIIKNLRWYILFSFNNIKDQVQNVMIRSINEEFVSIDITTFNSEYKAYNINHNLNHIYNNMYIFQKNKKIIINELKKVLNINEEFLLDLMIFRTIRGCYYNIDKEDLAIHFECLSSSYKVIKINKLDNFSESYKKYKEIFINKHFYNNLALSWMLDAFLSCKVFTQREYNNYIKKFNEKADKLEKFAIKIRNEEIPVDNLIERLIDIDKKVSYNKKKILKEKSQYENKIKKDNLVQSNIPTENKNNYLQHNTNHNTMPNEDDKDEIMDIIDIDLNINDNSEKRANNNAIKNNIINNVDRTQIEIFKKKEQKKTSWLCCGKESVDVID